MEEKNDGEDVDDQNGEERRREQVILFFISFPFFILIFKFDQVRRVSNTMSKSCD